MHPPIETVDAYLTRLTGALRLFASILDSNLPDDEKIECSRRLCGAAIEEMEAARHRLSQQQPRAPVEQTSPEQAC